MTAAVNAGSAPSVPAPMPKEELAKMDHESNAETPKAQGPNAPAQDQRTPAGDDKKDGAKGEGASKDGQAGPVARNDGGGDKGRGPANADGPKTECSMCGAPPAPPPPPPIAAGPQIIRPPEVPRINDDQRVRDTIKGGNTNLIIRVK
jgi:hypothetical protein